MEKIMEQMRDTEFELIFVDDGSSDHTLDLFHKLWKKDKRCRYLSFSRNFGKEAALYAGLQHARGDYIAVMDVDLQDPPGLLVQMYEELERGEYDCVAARRVDRKGEKRARSFLSAMFYKVAKRVFKVQLVEGARDFRMMNRKMADAILQMGEYNRFFKRNVRDGWAFGQSGWNTTMRSGPQEKQNGRWENFWNTHWTES
jgi:glycosyltransferase involved in cell wall biosynthesis